MVSFGPGEAIQGPKRTRIPDFDRPVIRPGNDQSPIRRELDGADEVAVRVLLLARQLQRRSCEEW